MTIPRLSLLRDQQLSCSRNSDRRQSTTFMSSSRWAEAH